MKQISEVQILPTVHLSDSQKIVMTKIIASPTEQVALEEINNGRNLVAATKELEDLKLIDVSPTSVKVTDTGLDVMKDENLIDDTGELTSVGQQYASVQKIEDVGKIKDTKPAPAPEQDSNADTALESIHLIRSIERELIENRIMELLSIQTST